MSEHFGILIGYGLRGSGSTVYAVELAETLIDEGHTVSLICHECRDAILSEYGFVQQDQKNENLRWVNREKSNTIYSCELKLIPTSYSRPELRGATKILNCNDKDVDLYVEQMFEVVKSIHEKKKISGLIVNHLGLLNCVAKKMNENFSIPFISVVHGTFLHYVLGKSEKLSLKIKSSLNSCEKIVVLNKSVSERVNKIFPEFNLKFIEIPPGVDTQTFNKSMLKREREVSFVGRINFDKGIHNLLAMVPLVYKKMKDVRFSIAGDGPDLDFFKEAWKILCQGDYLGYYEMCLSYVNKGKGAEKVKDLKVLSEKLILSNDPVVKVPEEVVSWLGSVDREQASEVFRRSKCSILPSIVPEAHPLALCESFSVGTPVIATNFSGIKSIYDQMEKCGIQGLEKLKIEPNGSNLILKTANQLIEVLILPLDEIQQIKASQFIDKNYAWPTVGKKIVEYFKTNTNFQREKQII